MKKTGIRALSCLFSFLFLVSPAVLYSEAATTTTITNGKYYAIQNVHSGQFLDVRNAEFVSGNNIWQYPCNTTDSQQFLILGPENGITSTAYHQIAPKGNPSLRLDVDNAWDVNGTNIGIFMSNPGYGAQSFEFIPNGDGSFRINPFASCT